MTIHRLRELQKYFLVLFVSTTGFMVIITGLINSIFLHYISSHIQETRYKNYSLQCDKVTGGLITGFLLRDVRIQNHIGNEKQQLVELGSVYLKVNPFDLISRELTIEQAKVHDIEVSVANLDDFFQNLVNLSESQEALSRETFEIFRSVSCSRLMFYNLKLVNPLELFLSKQEELFKQNDLKFNEQIRFQGSLEWDDRLVKMIAKAQDFNSRAANALLPIQLELILDWKNIEGEVALRSKGTSVRNLVTMKGLSYDGSITMESRLVFSTHQDRAGKFPAKVDFLRGDPIYYSLRGEGRLFSSYLRYLDLELNDLYLRGLWTHRQFELAHSQALFLGSLIQGSYDYNQGGNKVHSYEASMKKMKIDKLMGALKIPQLQEDLKGEFSFSMEGEKGVLNFSPMEVHELSYLGTPVFLKQIAVESVDFASLLSSPYLKFHSRGGSWLGAFVDSIEGDLNREAFAFKLHCEDVALKDIDPIKKRAHKVKVTGRANVDLEGRVLFSKRDFELSSKGSFHEVEVGGLPIEYLRFDYRRNKDQNEWKWDLGLPVKDGKFHLKMDLMDPRGLISLQGNNFDLAYFKQRFKDFPFVGISNWNLDLKFEPIFHAHLKVDSEKIDFQNLELVKPGMEVHLKEKKYQLRFWDESARVMFHGFHHLAAKLDGGSLVGESLWEYLGATRFEIKEDNFARYKSFPILKNLRFSKGDFELKGDFDPSSARVTAQRIRFTGTNHTLELGAPAEIRYETQTGIETRFQITHKNGLNNSNKQVASFSLKNEDLSLSLQDFTLGLLREFAPENHQIPLHGNLNLKLSGKSLKSDPQLSFYLLAQPLYVDVVGGDTYVEKLEGNLKWNSEGMEVEDIRLSKAGSEFQIQGYLPVKPMSWVQGFEEVEGKELNLKVQLPKTPVGVIRDFLPKSLDKLKGDFSLDSQLTGTLSKPELHGDFSLDLDSMEIWDDGNVYPLSATRLDVKMRGESLEVLRLSGNFHQAVFHFSGEFFPLENYRFILKGNLARPTFTNEYLRIDGVRLSNVYLTGVGDRLSGFGNLEAQRGVVDYEDLMSWIERDTEKLQIPYIRHYDFGLKIAQKKGVQLKADYFQMEIEPDLTITIGSKETILDGHILVRDGHLEMARNRFRLEQGSLIRFIPRQQNLNLNSGEIDSLDPNQIWNQSSFQTSSLEDKLDTLWKTGKEGSTGTVYSLLPGQEKKTFETRLNLRAETEVARRRVTLALNGPLETMNYSLYSDDGTLNRGDILRLLASKGLGRAPGTRVPAYGPGGDNEVFQTDSRQDETLIGGQISATLEDEVLGRPFESLLSGLFRLEDISLQPNLIGENKGLGRIRMGTRLGQDVRLTHEEERLYYGTKSETKLEFQLDDELGLILKRESLDHQFDLSDSEADKDFQFGFERRLKF